MTRPGRAGKRAASNSRDATKVARGLYVSESPIDGLGCFAAAHFHEGGLIAEYTGQKINHREAMLRMSAPGPKHISELSDDCYIDGSIGGNGSQYINHSCEPNADVLIKNERMLIVPLRDIAPGEEITIDYLNSFEEDLTDCRCRSRSCKRAADPKAA